MTHSAVRSFMVGPLDEGQRLDRYLAGACPDLSRAAVQRLVREGHVTVNDALPHKSGHALATGDTVVIRVPPPAETSLIPEGIPVSILYQDEDILVVDKPSGLTVHPAPGHNRGTLVNALLGWDVALSSIGGDLRPGIVHRLDKDTSGLLLVAVNDAAHRDLTRQLQERTVEKGYVALVRGRLSPREGAIEAPLGRDRHNRKRMAVVEGGRDAWTDYRVLAYLEGYTLLDVHPRTGRTHQIRVHLASIGHPIAGDPVYRPGGPSRIAPRLFLHAHRLAFRHPRTGEPVEFTSPLPADLAVVLRELAAKSPEVLQAMQRLL